MGEGGMENNCHEHDYWPVYKVTFATPIPNWLNLNYVQKLLEQSNCR
jgi:hypothetical protein